MQSQHGDRVDVDRKLDAARGGVAAGHGVHQDWSGLEFGQRNWRWKR